MKTKLLTDYTKEIFTEKEKAREREREKVCVCVCV